MNKEEFIKKLKELNINLTEEQIKQFEIYCDFLIEYNSHTNLTAIKEPNQIYLKHFYDSLTITKTIDLNKINKVIDIGTGPGFPGMVLKIAYPNIKITLLDSNNKKINFLKELSNKLKINDIEFYHGRAEEYCVKNRETFDLVTARAVSNMCVLTELCLPLTKINGYFIALKGSNDEEITDSLDAIKILGGNIEKIETFTLPKEESGRNIVKVKKIKETPLQYPRRYEKIVKSPLKIKSK